VQIRKFVPALTQVYVITPVIALNQQMLEHVLTQTVINNFTILKYSIMKKSLKSLLKKMQESNFGAQKDGFTVLRNVRGGKLPSDNSGSQCTNAATATCTGSNQHNCDNLGDCTGTTNHNICSNHTCYE
jgi:hypothetical protein